MEKRTTIYDIAKKLGISTATVNRALTGKPRVKEETRALVIRTAEEMGFKPNTIARSLARRRIRLAVVGFTSFPEFHGAFLQGACDAALDLQDFNVEVDYFSHDEGATNTAEADAFLLNVLTNIADGGYDGALVLAKENEGFTRLKEKGVCVATAVNDIETSLRRFCIWHNGQVAGRIAAELIYRWLPDRNAPVALASGLPEGSIHMQNVRGFLQQIEKTPLNLAEVYYHYDNADLAYTRTCEILDKYPDLAAIYVNTFNSRGVIQAVQERGLGGKIILVTSDIYEELRKWIDAGVVHASIFQNQYEQGKQGIHTLYQLLANDVPVGDQLVIDPQIILSSNLALFG